MAMARAASELEAAGGSILHLEVGQPSSPAPAAVRAAAARALEHDQLGYTNAPGLLALREAIAAHYGRWYGVEVDPRHVVVTTGASAAFTLAFLACFDPGDRVGVIEPGYPCYRNTLLALGASPVRIAVGPDTGWIPTPALLDAAGPLRGLVVASPSNPTGAVIPPVALKELAAWCEEHDVQFVSDEIYHGITYGQRAETALTCSPDAIVVSSFSKYFSMTGWRLGWIVATGEMLAAVERFQQNLYICAPTLSQRAAVVAFECTEELDSHVTRYATNRSLLLDGLRSAGLTEVATPDGAFYAYVDISSIAGDSMELCRRWLADAGLATTPGLDFDLDRGHRFVRLSYSGPADDIAEAGRRLTSWVQARR